MLKNLTISLGLSLLLFALGETAARLVLRAKTPTSMHFDTSLIYDLQPDSIFSGQRLNNIGCIGPDISPEKPQADTRILLLGGSTSFSGVLQQTMQETIRRNGFPNAVAISCGRPRYTSATNASLFQQKIDVLKPDLVVVYLGINDNIYNTFRWLENRPDVGYFNWKTKSNSVLIQLVRYHLFQKRLAATPNFGKLPLRSPSILTTQIEKILSQARTRDIPVLLAPIAAAWPTDDALLAERILQQEAIMEHFWGTIDSTMLGVRKHRDVLQHLSQKHTVGFVEPRQSIPNDSRHFIDICHLTVEGNRKLGTVLGERAAALLRHQGGMHQSSQHRHAVDDVGPYE